MDDRSVFHLISDFTNEQHVSCVLIGGFAINHYRVTRQTADVDFLITEIDIKDGKFKELCLKYGTEQLYKQIVDMSA